MNRYELYDKIVDLYLKTGQGMADFVTIVDSSVNHSMKHLIELGVVKKVNVRSVGNFYCLTDRYCSEDDPNPSALTFVRYYLGHSDLGLGVKPSDVDNDSEFQRRYNEWLKLNQKELERSFSNKTIKPNLDIKLSDSDIEFCRSREWYSDTVSNAIKAIEKVMDINRELSYNYQHMMNIVRDHEKLKEYTDRKKEVIEDNKMRDRIISYLEGYPMDVIVNTII